MIDVSLQGINIFHLGKRKIIFKMPFWGDMLVPWRVSPQMLVNCWLYLQMRIPPFTIPRYQHLDYLLHPFPPWPPAWHQKGLWKVLFVLCQAASQPSRIMISQKDTQTIYPVDKPTYRFAKSLSMTQTGSYLVGGFSPTHLENMQPSKWVSLSSPKVIGVFKSSK